MTCMIQAAGTIELYFYGELPPSERAGVEAHLKRCAECRQALEDLSVIRASLASLPDVATPPGGDWSAFMARLDGARQRPAGHYVDVHARETDRVVATTLRRRIGPYLAFAALLALVTIGALLVFTKVRQPDAARVDVAAANSGVPQRDAVPAALSPDPALVSLSGQHFERSKLVVLGLAAKDATKPVVADWAYERNLATTLLGDTRLYRQAAEERGMDTLAGVMQDLELVLLQTSMSQDPDRASLEQLQRLIRRRDLLTKMNVVHAGGL